MQVINPLDSQHVHLNEIETGELTIGAPLDDSVESQSLPISLSPPPSIEVVTHKAVATSSKINRVRKSKSRGAKSKAISKVSGPCERIAPESENSSRVGSPPPLIQAANQNPYDVLSRARRALSLGAEVGVVLECDDTQR